MKYRVYSKGRMLTSVNFNGRKIDVDSDGYMELTEEDASVLRDGFKNQLKSPEDVAAKARPEAEAAPKPETKTPKPSKEKRKKRGK